MPEVDLIEIGLENLVLRVVPLHLACGRLLAELARKAQIAPVDDVRVHVADQLLRDRARTAPTLTQELPLDSTGNADQIDTVVLVKALILHGDERVLEVSRHALEGDARSKLMADLSDERSIARQDERRLRYGHDLPRFGVNGRLLPSTGRILRHELGRV